MNAQVYFANSSFTPAFTTTTYSQTYLSDMYLVPNGLPLQSPKVDMWICERQRNSERRQIIEVSCGNYIVCKGKRRTRIEWKNLDRYVVIPGA